MTKRQMESIDAYFYALSNMYLCNLIDKEKFEELNNNIVKIVKEAQNETKIKELGMDQSIAE